MKKENFPMYNSFFGGGWGDIIMRKIKGFIFMYFSCFLET